MSDVNEECANMRCAVNGHLISRGALDGVSTKREFMMIRVCGNYNSQRWNH